MHKTTLSTYKAPTVAFLRVEDREQPLVIMCSQALGHRHTPGPPIVLQLQATPLFVQNKPNVLRTAHGCYTSCKPADATNAQCSFELATAPEMPPDSGMLMAKRIKTVQMTALPWSRLQFSCDVLPRRARLSSNKLPSQLLPDEQSANETHSSFSRCTSARTLWGTSHKQWRTDVRMFNTDQTSTLHGHDRARIAKSMSYLHLCSRENQVSGQAGVQLSCMRESCQEDCHASHQQRTYFCIRS